jgi:hypothetical protein
MQKPIAEAFCERGAAGEDDATKKALPQVHVRSVDGIYDDLMDSFVLEADALRIEKNLGRTESFWTEL